VEQPDTRLDEELRRGAQYLAHRLTPTAGAIPRIAGIDIHGVTFPLNGVAGGDLLTYTDGLIEPLSAYTQDQLERVVSRVKDDSAQIICEAIVCDRQATAAQTDDLTLVVIKYR